MWKLIFAALVTAFLGNALVIAEAAPQPGEKEAKEEPPEPGLKEPAPSEANATERIKAALAWLADHQSSEGNWSADQFSADSTRKEAKKTYNLEFNSPGEAKGDKGWSTQVDVGLTGLALMAFLGAGNDHRDGDYKDTCRRAIMYLRKCQTNDGCFGSKDDDSFVYCHGIATIAMCETFALSNDKALKSAVENAVEFILKAQNEGAGWRYGVKSGESDTSFTGWAVLALKSAKLAGVVNDVSTAFSGAAAFLDKMTVEDEKTRVPRTGYNTPGSSNARLRAAHDYENNPTMDAIHICAKLLMGTKGWSKDHPTVKAQANLITDNLPKWDRYKLDSIYWYWSSLALFQVGGKHWDTWSGALSKVLTENQRGWRAEDKGTSKATLDEHGSWDAVDAWSTAGGRVYTTAVNCLTLEIFERGQKLKKDK